MERVTKNFPDRESEDKYWYYDVMFQTVYLRRAPKNFDDKQIFNLMVNKLKTAKCFVNIDHHKLTTRQTNKLENYRDYPQYYPMP